MSETQDSKSTCCSIDTSCGVSPLCDGNTCSIRFTNPPTESKETPEETPEEESSSLTDEVSVKTPLPPGLDQLFSSLLGSVFQGGAPPIGTGNMTESSDKLKDLDYDLSSDEDEDEDEDEVDDNHKCDLLECRNGLRWRALNKLLESHSNLTSVMAELWESENID